MSYIALFFAGAFLMNVLPHLVAGVTGRAFPTIFAKPPGEGLSSPVVNIVWAFINLVVAYLLLWLAGGVDCADLAEVAAFGAGLFVMALLLARYFGKFFAGRE